VAASCAADLIEEHRGYFVVEAGLQSPEAVGDSEVTDETHVVLRHAFVLFDFHVFILRRDLLRRRRVGCRRVSRNASLMPAACCWFRT
jgi:hypothetical protein